MATSGLSREVLENGLTILLKEQDKESMSFGIGIKFGTAYHQAAHLLEHLPFKGTRSRSYKEINRQSAYWGGDFDAFTDFFSTFFITKTLPQHGYEALELLCDMIKNPLFEERELEYEKRVVSEEGVERSGEPEQILMDNLYRILFHNHPLEKAVLEDKRFIRVINRDEVIELHRKFYVPARIVVIGVGPIDKGTVLEIVKRHFPGKEKASKDSPAMQSETPPPTGRIVIPSGSLKRIHLMIGFKTVPRTHPDFYALRVLSAAMGEKGNLASWLYEKVRERKGLVYHITSHFDTVRSSWQSILKADCTLKHGVLRIYTSFSPKNLLHVEETIKKELQRIVQEGISEEELEITKQGLINRHKLETLGTFRYMRLLFAAEVNNSIHEFHIFDEKVTAVTKEDVKKVAQQYCHPNKGVWIILKPQKNSLVNC